MRHVEAIRTQAISTAKNAIRESRVNGHWAWVGSHEEMHRTLWMERGRSSGLPRFVGITTGGGEEQDDLERF